MRGGGSIEVVLLVGMGRLVRVEGNLDPASYIDTLNEQNRIRGNSMRTMEEKVLWFGAGFHL